MTPLTDPDRSRLASMLALAERDQNPSDGERLAAITAVERLLAKRSLRLRDLADAHAADRPRRSECADSDALWRSTVQRCLDHHDRITAWEFDFLISLGRFHRLSQKQSAILAKIAKRLGVGGDW